MSERIVDPGNEVSKPKPHTLEWVMDFVRRHPGATTGQGEADLLVAEIDRLREELEEALDNLCMAFVGGRGCDSDIVDFLKKHNREDPR